MSAGNRDRRTTWLLLCSIAVGLVASFVLAIFAFGGGTESVITGALLLGDGVGWALIAAVTTRFTDHPQRWARVPAIAMSVVGTVLLVAAPGASTMNRLSWVWPPLLLALVLWMTRRMKRTPTPRGRWVLNLVVAFYVLCAVGATFQNVSDLRDRHELAAPGGTYLVHGHRLHLDCEGSGSPTVVLENGLGGLSTAWIRVVRGVAPTTRICAYDRAGQGWSDSVGPQSPAEATADLHDTLAMAGERAPYVLVGHSTGGVYAMAYAVEHLDQVAGVVLLDSATPEQFTALSAYPGQYSVMRRGLALVPSIARFGLTRALALANGSDLPAPAAGEYDALTSTARAATSMRDELSVLPQVFDRARDLTTLDGRPLAVVTASDTLSTDGWEAAQDKMAQLSTRRIHRTVDSTHVGLLEDPDGAQESIRAIEAVVESVRRGTGGSGRLGPPV